MESLYRKYRPQTFEDVVGQQHVVSTLTHAVLEGRTSHAYLFCGPRGTGKTTMARLLAKALLCEKGEGQLPDGSCEQCELIAAGEHPDVYELDAASRTGVDSVREEIINNVSFAPVRGRHKVYIIDEVHMLTTAAFNALLKTLEEPPEHVVFILCTTDPQKVPATILSRVQRFDFHAMSNEDLQRRLAYVSEQEHFSYESAALELIARHARGGMRDALSSLEQLSVFGMGTISFELASNLLGGVASTTLANVNKMLAARDIVGLFSAVSELIEAGQDLLQFTRQLAGRLRDVYVVAAVGPQAAVVYSSSEELDALSEEAAAFGSADRVARILRVLSETMGEMRSARNPRLTLELALMRAARPQSDLTLESLAERLAALEAQLAGVRANGASGKVAAGMPPAAPRAAVLAQATAAPSTAVQSAPATAAIPASAQPAAAKPSATQPSAALHPATAQLSAAPHPATAQPTAAKSPTVQPIATQSAAAESPTASQSAATESPTASQSATTVPPAIQQDTLPTVPAEVFATQISKAQTTAGSSDWGQVLSQLQQTVPSSAALLLNSQVQSDDGSTLTIALHNASAFALKMLNRSDVAQAVRQVVTQQFGPRQITYVTTNQPTPMATPPTQTTHIPSAGQTAPTTSSPAFTSEPTSGQSVPATNTLPTNTLAINTLPTDKPVTKASTSTATQSLSTDRSSLPAQSVPSAAPVRSVNEPSTPEKSPEATQAAAATPPDFDPTDAASVMKMLTSIFGDGVKKRSS